ncbi:ABC transporter G family [Raphidocelis subcapitata]|uniref:ABC transporter G family n=1 Tax=Raphidocelis subcapitata TaxID=307507 RepID=A0A2V0NWI1_9CHLO|nr:ABC transporter G family [Raphidocelis subcapitata]|eukprot:GBF91998.1 ABC transporter G family [Raphidocelis subcapitata]
MELSVWLPPFILAHVFAAAFAILALATLAPGLWRRLLRRPAPAPGPPLPRPSSADLWRKHGAVGKVLLLEWDGVGCAYSTQAGIKTVLKDVGGSARPFQMSALLGPSGAGKSTLLDILAGRKTLGRLTGTVLVNGRPRGGDFARCVSYVPQEDSFLPTMTVDETCAFHAALTLPRGTSRQQRGARAEEVLAAMGLLGTRGTLVGGVLPGGISLRGLSGGERKRLSVAVGILAAPSILFLDEPTSGLDSCSALSVVEHLRDRAADSGLTIVSSIHQPRAAVWAAFDSVSLLSEGALLYAGPCSEIVSWFESIGLGPWRPDVHGTACDWVMDLVNIGFEIKPQSNGEGRTITTRGELDDAAARFAAHFAASTAQGRLENGGSGGGGGSPGKAAAPKAAAGAAAKGADSAQCKDADSGSGVQDGGGARRRPSWWTAFCALLWRELLWTMRNPADVAGRMLLFAYLGAGCGVVFWRAADAPGLDSLRDRINVLFILVQQFLMMPFVYMSLYSADKRHYVADVGARLYTTSPYYAAKSVAVLPFVIVNTLVCSYTAYGMIGLRVESRALAVHGATSVLVYLVAHQVHSASSIIMPNEDTAFLVTIAWSAYNFYFAGFLIKADDMVVRWLPPLRWLSALNYAYPLYVDAEFRGASFPCSGGLVKPGTAATLSSLLPATPALRSGALTAALTARAPGCVAAGDAVLDYFGVTLPVWAYFLALIAYLAAAHVATYCGLLLLARRERR